MPYSRVQYGAAPLDPEVAALPRPTVERSGYRDRHSGDIPPQRGETPQGSEAQRGAGWGGQAVLLPRQDGGRGPHPTTSLPPSRRRAPGPQWRGVAGGLPGPLTPPLQPLGTALPDPSGKEWRTASWVADGATPRRCGISAPRDPGPRCRGVAGGLPGPLALGRRGQARRRCAPGPRGGSTTLAHSGEEWLQG